MLTKRSEVFRL